MVRGKKRFLLPTTGGSHGGGNPLQEPIKRTSPKKENLWDEEEFGYKEKLIRKNPSA